MRYRSEQHVRRQRDFRHRRENGRRLDCAAFTFWSLKRDPAPAQAAPPADSAPVALATVPVTHSPDTVRLAVVASTASIGNAIQRARAKRRLRETFRRHQQLVPPGHDIMLIARRPLNRATFAAIEHHFTTACRRAFQAQPK
jgi:ribonuclease P protein component